MSATPAGDEIRDDTAPSQPPITRNPLRSLVVPGLLAVVIICGVIYGVIPMWNVMVKTDKNYQKMREDSVRAYSRTYQVPTPPPPIYVPGNNPNGPFTPPVP